MKNISLTLVLFLIATLALGNMSMTSHILKSNSTGLVAWYPFNGNANDASGNANHGTVYGAILTADRFGTSNSAYEFDGVDDYIQCLQPGPLGTSPRTISFWAKTDIVPKPTQTNTVLSYGGSNLDRLEINLNSGANGLTVTPGNAYLTKAFDNTNADWHFYTVVFEGGSDKTMNDFKFYADGQLLTVTSETEDMGHTINTMNTHPIHIGNLPDFGRFFKGTLDEIKFYSIALTEDEVKSSYHDLVAYYPFNGNANDESGNGYHGSVNGGILTEDRNNSSNSAYTFPNLHDQIVLANTANMNLQGGFTLNAWVKYKNINCGIVGKHSCWVPNGFYLGIDEGQFWLRLSDGGWYDIKTYETYENDKWYMVTGVYDSIDQTAAVYVNGQLKASGPAIYNLFNSVPITISEASNGCPDGNMPGAIDDVKIFNRSLTAEEIHAEYNATQTGLVAFYPFNGNANDVGGNLLHGSVDGATLSSDRFGIVNSAYLFDGNDIITIAYNDKLNADQELSISVWVKPDLLQDALILGKSNWWTQTNYLIRTKSTGFIQFEYRDMAYNTDNPLIVGQWNHIAVVSDAGNSKKVYINGVLATHTGGVSPFNMVPEVLTIGGASYGSEYFNGAIDDLRIYKTTLSEIDILNLYNNTTVEIEKTQELTLHPYFVFNNSLHFKNQQNSNDIKNIEIYNLLGQKVFETSIITEPISLNGLQKGVYILKVLNKNGKRNVLKFSIE